MGSKGPLLIGGFIFCIILVIVVVGMTKSGNDEAPPTSTPAPIPEPVVAEDVLIEPSTPSDSYESATWEEAKKSQRPGHPKSVHHGGSPIQHIAAGDSWYLVGKGRAPTEKTCWEFSKRNKINTYAWRKGDKSCWAYQDSFLYNSETHDGSGRNHVSGCTLPGRQLKDGCEDLDRGDIVIGHKPGSKWGGLEGADRTHKKMSLAECREAVKETNRKALESGEPNDTVYAVGYRTNNHKENNWTNTCFVYANPREDLKGWYGNHSDTAHVTACIDPTKKVRDGCV